MEKDTVRDDVKKSIQGLMWQGKPQSKNVENRLKDKKSETRIKTESVAEMAAKDTQAKAEYARYKVDKGFQKQKDDEYYERTNMRLKSGLDMPGDRVTLKVGKKDEKPDEFKNVPVTTPVAEIGAKVNKYRAEKGRKPVTIDDWNAGEKERNEGMRKSIEDAEQDLMRRNTEEQKRYKQKAIERGDPVATQAELDEAEKRAAKKAKKK